MDLNSGRGIPDVLPDALVTYLTWTDMTLCVSSIELPHSSP